MPRATAETETVVSGFGASTRDFFLLSFLPIRCYFSINLSPCPQVPGMQEILLIGFYQPDEPLTRFLEAAQQEFNLPVRSGVCTHVLHGVGEP